MPTLIDNFTLGRGKLYLAQFISGTQTPAGERYLGNSPDLAFTADSSTLDHYNSDAGIKIKNKSMLLQVDYSASITLDDIQTENLAMYFLGNAQTQTTAALTAQSETIVGVSPGLFYQLGVTPGTPVGVRNVSNVVVKSTAATPVTYVLNTDYTVDLVRARVMPVKGGAIADASSLAVTYDVAASTRQRMVSAAKSVEGTLRFIADNPSGDNIDYFMPHVMVAPDGDYTIKGDDWQQVKFKLSVLQKSGYAAIYADGQPYSA